MSTNNERPQSATDKLKEAETVRDELCEALHDVGIALPSLRVEPLAYGDVRPRPLVELGRCNLVTAQQLVTALRSAKGQVS
jgi:hypothetical protein